MKRKFKLGALAWGIVAALMAFPTNGAAADNNSAVCNLLATGNTYACRPVPAGEHRHQHPVRDRDRRQRRHGDRRKRRPRAGRG